MEAIQRTVRTGVGRVSAKIDFTEALLLVALATCAKTLGLW
jgi:hypothetical protein